jgi:hypothetical protein
MKTLILLGFYGLFFVCGQAQPQDGLVARYSFNRGVAINDVSEQAIKAVGVSFAEDRFGNNHSACLLNGNRNSYLNLGVDKSLKPTSGSIVVWVQILQGSYSGVGYESNPIVLTKSRSGDDFFEAYSIAYSLSNKRFGICCTHSDTNQLALISNHTVSLEKWYHLVMTYNDTLMSFYVDGVLEHQSAKNFRTTFLEADSVMIGYTANEKNNRFLYGMVDDISIYSRVLTAEEVRELYNEADPNFWRTLLKYLLLGIVFTTVIWIIVQFFTRKYKRQLLVEKEKRALQHSMYTMEMHVIKAQMNPHFIFNAMNSIQQFVLSNDTENANNYLIRFSRLLRKTLESNTDETINIANEIDIVEKYLEIEALRFDSVFQFSIHCDEKINQQGTQIPQLLIQPFVENAIWHGLIPKIGDKVITITFELINSGMLRCTIDDNGIGRAAASKAKSMSSRKSLGIPFIQQRLQLLSKLAEKEYTMQIIDKVDAQAIALGTTIILNIPITQNDD